MGTKVTKARIAAVPRMLTIKYDSFKKKKNPCISPHKEKP
jgi:hypothetical protein